MIRGFMPLGVAHWNWRLPHSEAVRVIRGFMPLGVAHIGNANQITSKVRDSWLDAVRRCSNIEIKLMTAIAKVIRSFISKET